MEDDLLSIEVLCMACEDGRCDFKPTKFQRRPLGENDIKIDMKFCGICHTDLHCAGVLLILQCFNKNRCVQTIPY